MTNDVVEEFGRSVIQHGSENDRVYLMKLAPADLPEIVTSINSLAVLHRYSKALVLNGVF